ncbi:MAG: V-type ATPase 116kDa subunit family protein [Lachnospiraceae bacterium]|nr:V-type ATPase 116kDa subunit family protein [Lachnospiraceae bacterium]
MIVKMKFLSITGPKADIDRVVNKYLSKYEIHLENALSELKTVKNLRPYIEINPYREWLSKANEFAELLKDDTDVPTEDITLEESIDALKNLDSRMEAIRKRRSELEAHREELYTSLHNIEPFLDFDYDIHSVLRFKYIRYRFGKIAKDYYEKLEKYVYENLDTVFFKCHSDDQYIWGVYFAPAGQTTKLDAVYSSLHFERVYLPDEYDGTPKEAYDKLNAVISDYTAKIAECQKEILTILSDEKAVILSAREKLASLSTNFDVRKLAACTKEKPKVFYILCGWMSEADARAFEQDISNDSNLYCIIEDDHNNLLNPPPTKLKNPRLIRPFEMFVRMYGLPSYNELDPTPFVALTYAFIFGAMFGDVGQGLCLVLGGALLYKFKKLDLAAIISCAGVFSAIFGFLFGSFFGFEDVLPALWLRPTESMTTLPFIGKLNTVFVVAIAFGMFLILMTMIFHIINAVKAKDAENTWFDTNGLAGFVFYTAVVAVVALFMTGHALPAGIVLAIMFLLPLLLIALKEPLTRLVEHKAELLPGGKGMFIVQTVFEMFEVLLSYFSNTLSFVRIGAFAVSHAAMMQVVLMLAGAENGGSPNWFVIILGNIFVCGMEGLIVGIQVLRLEYYEMFSRFYKGGGREFKSFTKRNAKA